MVPGVGMPPILIYERSLPQMPQAFIFTTTSLGPAAGRS